METQPGQLGLKSPDSAFIVKCVVLGRHYCRACALICTQLITNVKKLLYGPSFRELSYVCVQWRDESAALNVKIPNRPVLHCI